MEQIPESKEKNQRMYIEVRFQKNTSKFLKKDCVFNLCLYFDQSRCVSSLSMGDLQNILNSLKSSTMTLYHKM